MAGIAKLFVIVLVLSIWSSQGVRGAKILLSMTMVVNSVSQHILFSAITEPLVERGHEVILLAPKNKYLKGLSERAITGKIFYENDLSESEMKSNLDVMKSTILLYSTGSFRENLNMAAKVKNLFTKGCLLFWKDRKTLARLQKENFDLILTMPVAGCDALLSEYLNVPFVAMTPLRRLPTFSEDTTGMPAPSSYVPFNPFLPFTDKRSFWQRVVNFLSRHTMDNFLSWSITSELRDIQREFNIRPDLTVGDLLGRALLWLCQFHVALEFAQPTLPNYVPIGGITVKPPKPLPLEMEDFVQNSGEHGVIVFTLGSVLDNMKDDHLAEIFAKVFSELPQRVLWRYTEPRPRNLGNNTLLADWLPQNDLLGHPKTRLLIYHGGANGIYEAAQHGIPMLLMPFALDQMANAARIEAKGLGMTIDKTTLTEDKLREVLRELLHNPKYTKNMKRTSGIMKDVLVPTRDRVAHLIEHVIKFGGKHLRTRALELNFIQRDSLDVIAFILAVLCTCLFVSLSCVRCCLKRVCRRNASKVSKSKSD